MKKNDTHWILLPKFWVMLTFLFAAYSPLAALDYYWVGGSGNWSDHANHWAKSSGGAVFHDQVPQSTDNVFFDANAFPAGGTVTIDQTIIYCNSMDWTGVTNAPSIDGPSDKMFFIYGSLKLVPGMTWNIAGQVHFLSFNTGNTITSGGKMFLNAIYFNGTGGEWTLMDPFETNSHIFQYSGTIRSNNQDIRIGGILNPDYSSNLYITPKLFLGTSTIYLKNSEYLNFSPYHQGGVDRLESRQSSIIGLVGGSVNGSNDTFFNITFLSHFNPGGVRNCHILNKLLFQGTGRYEGANLFANDIEFQGTGDAHCYNSVINKLVFKQNGGLNFVPGPVSICGRQGDNNHLGEVVFFEHGNISGNNTFESLTFSPGKTYIIEKNTTQTITPLGNFIAQGTGGFPIEIKSCELGQQATFFKDGDPICLDFLYLTDMVASGTGFSYAGSNSNNVYNNSGWIFAACPACFTAPPTPAPTLDPASVTNVLPNGQATLILANLPAGTKAVWVDEQKTTELYASSLNDFQPFVPKSIKYYAFIKDNTTGCITDTLAVVVCAATANAMSQDISCEGTAQIQLSEISGQGVSWAWTGPNTFTSAIQNPVILNPGSANAGDYTVVITDIYGCTAASVTNVSIYNTFSVTPLPASCHNGQQYIRILVHGQGNYTATNNGAGNLSATTVAGGSWLLLSGLNDNDTWNVTVTKNGAPAICSQTIGGTLTTCANAPNMGCSDPMNITQNNTFEDAPSVSGNYAVWIGNAGSNPEIYLYDIQADSLMNISNDPSNDIQPQISGDYVFWRSSGTYNHALYHIPTQTVSYNFANTFSPAVLAGDYVVGVAYDGDQEIFAYKISSGTTSKITNNTTDDSSPQCDGQFVAWTRDNNIYHYNLSTSGPLVQITNDGSFYDYLSVKSGHIVWQNTSVQVMEYNVFTGGPLKALSSATEYANWSVTDGQYVAWTDQSDRVNIYDLSTNLRTMLSQTLYTFPISITNGKVTWSTYGTNGINIICYDAATGTAASMGTSINDVYPVSNGQQVIWKTDLPAEIYIYDLSYLPPAPALDTNLSDTATCSKPALVLANVPSGHEAIWFSDIYMTVELYANQANLFEPNPYTTTTYYGGYRNLITGCVSKLIPITLYGKPDPGIQCPILVSVGTDPNLCTAVVNNLQPLNLSAYCPATLSFTTSGATTLSGNGDASGQIFASGNTLVEYLYTDSANKSASCAFFVYVDDDQAPDIQCPAPVTINTVPGFCYGQVINTNYDATANDLCPAFSISHNVNGAPNNSTLTNTSFSIGLNEITWIASDQNGNYSICVSQITVQDNEPPAVIECPSNIVASNTPSLCGNYVNWNYPVFSDNCSGIQVTNNVFPALFPVGVTLISYIATDNAGNQSTCSFTVTIMDAEAPVVQCFSAPPFSTNAGQCSTTIVNTDLDATGTDNCGLAGVLTHNFANATNNTTLNGAVFALGTTNVIWSVMDNAGNIGTCLQQVEVRDLELPQLHNCPPAIIQVNTTPGQCTAPATWTEPTATDNCAVASTQFSHVSGTLFPVGTTQVVFEAFDQSNNNGFCITEVLVTDVELPMIQCVNNIVLDNDPNTCTKLVFTNFLDATATDNCGTILHLQQNYTPSPGNTSLAGTLFPVGTTNIIWSVEDQAGNTATCLQQVVVRDIAPPVFLNCPTQMVMVGNDPGQCGAKVNWTPPVALDNCALPVVTQTGGQVSGTFFPVTAQPVTITYLATDAAGNTASCAFDVLVLEVEKPTLKSGVVLPANVTISCDAMAGPPGFNLTTNDVQDNCTPSQNLVITSTETSTKGTNPGNCNFYTYQIIRTWNVTDQAGNTLVLSQTVNVVDNIAPVPNCQPLTVTLNDFGNANISAQQLNGGVSDNCAALQYLTVAGPNSSFTCNDLGQNAVVLTVSDPCGNTATCSATVTVVAGAGACTPVYDAQGSDPCVCLNNATTDSDGQFSEIIQIHALAGQTWTVTNATGLFLNSSPAPPAAPIAVPTGTAFSPGNTDGLDNDGDAVTDEADERVYYTLKARHIEGVGYSAVFSNALNQTIALGNTCFYPTPVFSDLNDPLCLYTPSFNIALGEINNAAGTTINIKVNGVPATTFNAATAGIGFHTLEATFDAGAAFPHRIVNGTAIDGPISAAISDPGCQQKIVKTIEVKATPTAVACNDQIQVSLDADCKDTLTADAVLEGTYYCYDDYIVQIDRTGPDFSNGPWMPGIVTISDANKNLGYRLIHQASGNQCWGNVKVEDKQAPALACPPNLTVHCNECTTPACTGVPGITDCDNTATQFTEIVTNSGQCAASPMQISRTWVVTDLSGNQNSCQQTIDIVPFDFQDLVFPADITINCTQINQGTASVSPDFAGRPSIAGFPIGNNGLCAATVGYDDVVLTLCPGDYEIIRKWLVRNVCLPLGPNNPVEHYQLVKVVDGAGPEMACPANLTVSTNPTACCANIDLPDLILTEHCSDIISLKASVIGPDSLNNLIQIANVTGHLANFPGNNLWHPDTLGVFAPTAACLKIGTYQVTYSAEDQCNNIAHCSFTLTVNDQIAPQIAADEWTQIAVGADGTAMIDALTFDDGSTDNCNPVYFKVRRMLPNTVQTADLYHDFVKFDCSDIGDTVQVILRVYDVDPGTGTVALEAYQGHYNEAMLQVLVEDKIKPVCTAPVNITVSCEAFDPSLWTYGTITANDNCSTTLNITPSLVLTQFDSLCNKGTITRRWTVADAGGNTTQCTQRVVVTYNQDYFVKFPADRIMTVCDAVSASGVPEFYGEDCELMAVTFTDEFYTVVPDACYKIERTWTVINWCKYDANLPANSPLNVFIPNPSPNATVNHPTNLPGVTVSAPGTTINGWVPTSVKINPTDPNPTNYSVFWNKEANSYTYKQIIKVLDGQDPTVTCPVSPAEFCDYSNNDTDFWNSNMFWDATIGSHDLCEGDANLEITATDACSGAALSFRYLLFLDLDSDGSMETVVNSVNPPGFNTVYFDNANTPNYAGGTATQFDFRPVAGDRKWGFGLQADPANGNNRTARVRWFNQANDPASGVVPQLPPGTHKIKWIIEDGCGNETVCEYTFIIKDCKKPTAVCVNGLSVNFMNTNPPMVQMWASDFLQYAEDNCTPSNLIKIGVRRSGQADGQGNTTGFPKNADGTPQTGVSFTCADLGTQLVELWALDKAGNADYCETYVLIQDNQFLCSPMGGMATIAGKLLDWDEEGVEDAEVELSTNVGGIPAFNEIFTNSGGDYIFSNALPVSADAMIIPTLETDPLNGINTWDLILTSRHILGIEPLNTPYKLIAADANKSGTITSFDIVELRKLILGTYSKLPNNSSWRFVNKTQIFTNPDNPFSDIIQETIQVVNVQNNLLGLDFIGIKVGDLDGSAIPNNFVSGDDRTHGRLLLDTEDRPVHAGETFAATFTADQVVSGYQFTLNLDGLEVENMEGAAINEEHYAIFPADATGEQGAVTSSWDAPAGYNQPAVFTIVFKATKDGRLSDMLQISSRITRAVAFKGATQYEVGLRFNHTQIKVQPFELYQNTPNPWADNTRISFYLPVADKVTLTVFSAGGQVLWTSTGNFPKGYNAVLLSAKEISGAGAMYYRMETSEGAGTKQMLRIR